MNLDDVLLSQSNSVMLFMLHYYCIEELIFFELFEIIIFPVPGLSSCPALSVGIRILISESTNPRSTPALEATAVNC